VPTKEGRDRSSGKEAAGGDAINSIGVRVSPLQREVVASSSSERYNDICSTNSIMSSTLYYKLQLKGEIPENNETEAFEGMRIKLIKFDIVDTTTQLGKLPSNTFTLRVFNKTGDELNELNDDVKWNPSMGGGTTENPLIVKVEDLETETTTSGTFSWVVETERQVEALSFEWLRHCANASFLTGE
jgi:hypothetical protein